MFLAVVHMLLCCAIAAKSALCFVTMRCQVTIGGCVRLLIFYLSLAKSPREVLARPGGPVASNKLNTPGRADAASWS